jgi:hypothetical protein
VIEFAVVGFAVVLQQTPTAVNTAPPVDVTVPPELAELAVIVFMAVVVTVGTTADVVKLSSFP